MSPIFSLPAELLLAILDLVSPTSNVSPWERDDPWAFLRLSHVCSLWRELLVSSSKKWTTIPLGGHTRTEMMLEYARRATTHPIALHIVGGQASALHSCYKVSIPLVVYERTRVVILKDPRYLDWLHVYDAYDQLDLLHLGHFDRDAVGETETYYFKPSGDERHWLFPITLTCNKSVVLSYFSDTRLLFPRLRRLNVEEVQCDLFCDMIDSIDTPSLVSLHCKDFYEQPQLSWATESLLEPGRVLVGNLRHLSVVGKAETFIVLADLIRGVFSRNLEKLELHFCLSLPPNAWDLLKLDIWAVYASHARCISLTLEAHECVAILDEFTKHEFDRLECLQLRLPNHPASSPGLFDAYHALKTFLVHHCPPYLKRLDVSALLVIPEDDGWLESQVETLRRDEFDADEYDMHADSDETGVDVD